MKSLAYALTLIGCTLAFPRTGAAEVSVNPLINFGITFGGDTIGTVRTLSWFGPAEVPVDAGETFYVFGGVSLLWPNEQPGAARQGFGIQLQGGFLDGSNGFYEQEIEFNREAVELLGILERPRWRVGAGISWHSSSVLKGNRRNPGNIRFDSASGPVVQFDVFLDRFTVGVHYLAIDYHAPSRRLNGNQFGISGGYRFGNVD